MAFQTDFTDENSPAKWFRESEVLDGCPQEPAPRSPDGNLNLFLKALVDNDVHLAGLIDALSTGISSQITANLTNVLQNNLYPVGSIFITTLTPDPNTLLGFGTWEKFGPGRALVNLDSEVPAFATVGQTGGSLTSTSTSAGGGNHNHGGNTGGHALTINQMPPHNHNDARVGADDSLGNNGVSGDDTNFGPFNVMEIEGGGEPHNHPISNSGTHTHQVTVSTVQPYIVANIWKRVA